MMIDFVELLYAIGLTVIWYVLAFTLTGGNHLIAIAATVALLAVMATYGRSIGAL
jgi:hypothetical protein